MFYPDLINRLNRCKEIDLAAYLLTHENFTVSASSSRNTPVLKDPLNGFHYLIKRNPQNSSQYQAFITENVTPSGAPNFSKKPFTLIDIVMQRHHLSQPGQAVETIEKNSNLLTPFYQPEPLRNYSKEKLEAANRPLLPFTHNKYLTSQRSIHPDIINEPFLLHSLRNIHFSNYVNTAFPMQDSSGVIRSWCEKNGIPQPDGSVKSWQSFPEVSTNGLLFRSATPPDDIQYIVFSETPIDAISYYQLHHEFLNDKTLLVSSCGNINAGQLTHLQAIITENPSSKLICCNDFDAAGFRYDFMIASAGSTAYGLSDSIVPFFHQIKPTAGQQFFSCAFSSVSLAELKNFQVQLSVFSNSKMLDYKISPVYEDLLVYPNRHGFSVEFSYDMRKSKLLLEFFSKHFSLSEKILFDKPLRNNDWNDVLKNSVKENKFSFSDKALHFFSGIDTRQDNNELNMDKKKAVKR